MTCVGRTVVLFACFGTAAEPWLAGLQAAAPEFEFRVWPEAGDRGEIDYAIVWAPPQGFFTRFPNLKVVLSIGAGVDSLLRDPELPNLPLTRMVDAGLAAGMAEFVLARVLHYHRDMPVYAAHQRRAEWRPLHTPLARDRVVGVLGLGELGAHCAGALAEIGFQVRGWSRSLKAVPRVESFAGPLSDFLAPCHIVVCLLPLTDATIGILNAEAFSALSGAYLINVGRGGHLVEEDLIPALDAGHLRGATLDVFRQEPLPPEHPFWRDERIAVLPHVAALTDPRTAAPRLVANIRRHRAGESLVDEVDRLAGY